MEQPDVTRIGESDEVQQHGFHQALLELGPEGFEKYLAKVFEKVEGILDAVRENYDDCPEDVTDAVEAFAEVILDVSRGGES